MKRILKQTLKHTLLAAALTGYMIHGNSLGQASFKAKYGRPKTK